MRLKYLLGIEVAQSRKEIFISQWKYNSDLLQEIGMMVYKPFDTPIDPNQNFKEDERDGLTGEGRYQRLVDHLIYLFLTRLDISFDACY